MTNEEREYLEAAGWEELHDGYVWHRLFTYNPGVINGISTNFALSIQRYADAARADERAKIAADLKAAANAWARTHEGLSTACVLTAAAILIESDLTLVGTDLADRLDRETPAP